MKLLFTTSPPSSTLPPFFLLHMSIHLGFEEEVLAWKVHADSQRRMLIIQTCIKKFDELSLLTEHSNTGKRILQPSLRIFCLKSPEDTPIFKLGYILQDTVIAHNCLALLTHPEQWQWHPIGVLFHHLWNIQHWFAFFALVWYTSSWENQLSGSHWLVRCLSLNHAHSNSILRWNLQNRMLILSGNSCACNSIDLMLI